MSVKAVLMVGGPTKGTRFRPISLSSRWIPKPLFPIAGRPMILHHIEACAKLPSLKSILMIGFYEEEDFSEFVRTTSAQLNIPIRCAPLRSRAGVARHRRRPPPFPQDDPRRQPGVHLRHALRHLLEVPSAGDASVPQDARRPLHHPRQAGLEGRGARVRLHGDGPEHARDDALRREARVLRHRPHQLRHLPLLAEDLRHVRGGGGGVQAEALGGERELSSARRRAGAPPRVPTEPPRRPHPAGAGHPDAPLGPQALLRPGDDRTLDADQVPRRRPPLLRNIHGRVPDGTPGAAVPRRAPAPRPAPGDPGHGDHPPVRGGAPDRPPRAQRLHQRGGEDRARRARQALHRARQRGHPGARVRAVRGGRLGEPHCAVGPCRGPRRLRPLQDRPVERDLHVRGGGDGGAGARRALLHRAAPQGPRQVLPQRGHIVSPGRAAVRLGRAPRRAGPAGFFSRVGLSTSSYPAEQE